MKEEAGKETIVDGLPVELLTKINAYKTSLGLTKSQSVAVSNQCRKLEKKLGIKRILPREYIFLHSIAERLRLNQDLDLVKLAKSAGYPPGLAERPTVAILRNVDDRLFTEVVGFGVKDIEMETLKVMKQDTDLPAKLRALELAAKIKGLHEDGNKVQIQINSGIELAE